MSAKVRIFVARERAKRKRLRKLADAAPNVVSLKAKREKAYRTRTQLIQTR